MRTYVVFCHPTHESFVGEALERVLAGLGRAGHEVRVSDLYADGFRPELDQHDLAVHRIDHRVHPDQRPDICGYVENLQWCDTVVMVYPTWWSGQPAMLKGWFDRVWVRGVAWDRPDGTNRATPLLRNVRMLIAVTSHGSSKMMNALEGETGKRTMTRALRAACGIRCRSRWIAFYTIDRSNHSDRAAFLDRVEERMSKL